MKYVAVRFKVIIEGPRSKGRTTLKNVLVELLQRHAAKYMVVEEDAKCSHNFVVYTLRPVSTTFQVPKED